MPVPAFRSFAHQIGASLQLDTEELVGGCDAVVCPIDRVSHGACKLAKVLCGASTSRSFERALDQLAASGPKSNEAPQIVPGGSA